MSESVFFVAAESSLRKLETELAEHGFRLVWLATVEELGDRIDSMGPALVVISARLAAGGQLCDQLAVEHPEVEVVLTAPLRAIDTVLDVVEDADVEYLALPTDASTAAVRLRRAIRHRDARLELIRLRQEIARDQGFESILGTSPQMQEMFELLDRAALTRASVLITGESGTGKELVARALHQRGPRKKQPFVAINCSAVPDALLESELFGHVKGAFTDARTSRSGLFVRANGGTLFLDEIGDMPLALQPKLLRALQERRVRPVGGDDEVEIDVRVVAATHRDLERSVARSEFRQDLFYRLNVIHVDVPPLRERVSDILLLAERFALSYGEDLGKTITGISRAAARRLVSYGWPGNVRELQNSMECAVALTKDEEIQVVDLPRKIRDFRKPAVSALPTSADELVPLEEIERRYIARVLQVTQGNKKAAARILGLDRKTLYRKVERYRLEMDGPRETPGPEGDHTQAETG